MPHIFRPRSRWKWCPVRKVSERPPIASRPCSATCSYHFFFEPQRILKVCAFRTFCNAHQPLKSDMLLFRGFCDPRQRSHLLLVADAARHLATGWQTQCRSSDQYFHPGHLLYTRESARLVFPYEAISVLLTNLRAVGLGTALKLFI